MRNALTKILAIPLLALIGLAGNGLHAQVYLNYTVNQPNPLVASAGPDQLICPGDPATLGSIVTASGGYGGYTYTWTPSNTLNSSTVPNPMATPSVATTYQLMVQDSMGCSAFDSVTISIDTCVRLTPGAGLLTFDVFPNPNDGKFTVAIDLGTQAQIVSLSVLDLSGRKVYEKALQQPAQTVREQISLRDLSRGTYFIWVDADGQKLSRKMILR